MNIFEAFSPGYSNGMIIACGLLLPREQEKAAIKLSQNIAKKSQVKFLLKENTRPPFVRLYETVFPKKNIDRIMEGAGQIAQDMLDLPMDWGELEVTSQLVILWGEVNEAIRLFHRAILLKLNPLREGYYKQKYSQRSRFISSEEQDSLNKWGSPWAQNYIPHLVLAKAVKGFRAGDLNIDWKFRKCLLRGLIVGVKTNQDTFSDSRIFLFRQLNNK
jgi:hypothetical protein